MFIFNSIFSKVIDPKLLDEVGEKIIVTLYQLEIIFLCPFFDIMVYLHIHIVK